MQEQIHKQKGILTGKNIIKHDDSKCLRQWNHELYRAHEKTEIIDGVDYKGIELTPYATPKALSKEFIEKPMSMFSRAYNSKISQVTLNILSK